MGITRSLTLTLCAAATVTAAVGAAPARAADGRSGEGDAVLVTPAKPLPGESVGLLVPECAGAESGEAVSLAFSGTVRLTPGEPGGGLVGEARIDAETVPGHHPIQVTCGQPDGALYGLVTVGGGAPAADHAGGGADPTADGPEPLGDHGGEHGTERGSARGAEHGSEHGTEHGSEHGSARGEHEERCGPGHRKPEKPEKPSHPGPGHEKPEHTERPGHTERPDGTDHPDGAERSEHRSGGEDRGTGHGADDRCRHEGGREHGASPSAPVRAGGGGTAASLSSTPAQPAVGWGDALPAGLALLAGGGATWAVRRLRARSGSRAGR